MYLHLGQDTTLRTKDILGIFDLDNCSVSRTTRAFFKQSEDAKIVINVSSELPKSFILTASKPKKRAQSKKRAVYISQLSAATLKKRADGGISKNITGNDTEG